jgi:hypothetical protein
MGKAPGKLHKLLPSANAGDRVDVRRKTGDAHLPLLPTEWVRFALILKHGSAKRRATLAAGKRDPLPAHSVRGQCRTIVSIHQSSGVRRANSVWPPQRTSTVQRCIDSRRPHNGNKPATMGSYRCAGQNQRQRTRTRAEGLYHRSDGRS